MLVRLSEERVICHRLVLAGELVEVDDRVAALLGLVAQEEETQEEETLPFTQGFDPEPVEVAPVTPVKVRKGGK